MLALAPLFLACPALFCSPSPAPLPLLMELASRAGYSTHTCSDAGASGRRPGRADGTRRQPKSSRSRSAVAAPGAALVRGPGARGRAACGQRAGRAGARLAAARGQGPGATGSLRARASSRHGLLPSVRLERMALPSHGHQLCAAPNAPGARAQRHGERRPERRGGELGDRAGDRGRRRI